MKFYKAGERIEQGDVILKPLAKLPKEAKLFQKGAKVLQRSELTGHHHQFRPESKVDLYLVPPEAVPGISTITENQGKVIHVHEPSWLFHGKLFEQNPAKTGNGDHFALLVPPGIYAVDITREYSYEYHETRRVID